MTNADEFDLFQCGTCFEEYGFEENSNNPPRFLDCHHTFCQMCLLKIQVSAIGVTARAECIECPFCRKPTYLPQGGTEKLRKNSYLIDAWKCIPKTKVGIVNKLIIRGILTNKSLT